MNRSIQSEGTFAQMKYNDNFKRCMLRTKNKVEIKTILYSFAYNVRKLASKIFSSKLGEIIHSLKTT